MIKYYLSKKVKEIITSSLLQKSPVYVIDNVPGTKVFLLNYFIRTLKLNK